MPTIITVTEILRYIGMSLTLRKTDTVNKNNELVHEIQHFRCRHTIQP